MFPDWVGPRRPGHGGCKEAAEVKGTRGPPRGKTRGQRWRPGLRVTTSFSVVTTGARRHQNSGEKGLSARIPYPDRLSIKGEN